MVVRLHSRTAMDNRDDALRLKFYIDAYYAERLNTDALAKKLHVGKTNLYTVCENRFHMMPMQMVTHARIMAAQELVINMRESVKAFSQTVGFDDQKYFAKFFRKATEISPTAYRKTTQKAIKD